MVVKCPSPLVVTSICFTAPSAKSALKLAFAPEPVIVSVADV